MRLSYVIAVPLASNIVPTEIGTVGLEKDDNVESRKWGHQKPDVIQNVSQIWAC